MKVDIIEAVEHARRGKSNSPFVGVPTGTGEGTIMIRRGIFKASLKDLNVIDASVCCTDGGTKYLELYARGKGVKARRVYFAQNVKSYQAKLDIAIWRESQGKKALAALAPKLTARDKQLIRLRKQRARLGPLSRPGNPALPYCPIYAGYETKQRADEARKYRGELELRWNRERIMRRKVQALARGGKWKNTRELYRQLEALGLTVRRWSYLRKHDRDKCGDLDEYLKRLWEFCGLVDKPLRDVSDWRWTAERYSWWLEGLHARQELDSIIAELEAEADERES